LHHEAQTDVLDDRVVWSLGRKSYNFTAWPVRQLEDECVIWDGTIPVNLVTRTIFKFGDFLNINDRTVDSNTTDPFWAGCPVTQDTATNTDDWTHGNTIKRAEDGSNWMLASFRHINAVLLLSGIDVHGNPAPVIAKVAQIGGIFSDYTFPNVNDTFYHQHDARILPNGNLLMYDNGNFRPSGQYSRALELKLDHTARTATKVWEATLTIDNGQRCFSFCCGSVQRLTNGNTLVQIPNCVNDGSAFPGQYGYVVEYDPHSNIVAKFRMHLVDFVAFYRSREFGQSIGGEIAIE